LIKKYYKFKKCQKKREIRYPVVDPVPASSGTGSKNFETGPTGSGTGFENFRPGPTGTGIGSTKLDWILGPAQP